MVGSSGNFIQTWIQSGNIGIGTIAPNAKLSVSGSSDTPTGFGTFLVKNSSDVGISMGASSTSYVWLQGNYYGSGYNIPVVLQNAGGNVLIGTTTDAGQKLQVNGNAIIGGSGNPTLTINGTDAAYTGQLYINAAGAGSSKIIGNGGTNELNFETNNTLRLTVNSNGIKTAAPTTGTAAAWKLGSRVAAAVVLDATQYIELEVGGTLYKLAIVT